MPLIEIDEIVRVALEALLVVLIFATRKLDQARAEPPALQLAVIAVPMPQDFGDGFDELHGVLVDPPQNERPAVLRQREPKTELSFAPASLSTVK